MNITATNAVAVDSDAERDGVLPNRREGMSRNQTLVTGAPGMTGSHTVQLLLKHGHTVRVLADNEDERSMRLRLSRTSARNEPISLRSRTATPYGQTVEPATY